MIEIAKTKVEEHLESMLDLVGFPLKDRQYIHELATQRFLCNRALLERYKSYLRRYYSDLSEEKIEELIKKVYLKGSKTLRISLKTCFEKGLFPQEELLPLILRNSAKNANGLYIVYEIIPTLHDYEEIKKLATRHDFIKKANALISDKSYEAQQLRLVKSHNEHVTTDLVEVEIKGDNISSVEIRDNKYRTYFSDLEVGVLSLDKLAQKFACALRNY